MSPISPKTSFLTFLHPATVLKQILLVFLGAPILFVGPVTSAQESSNPSVFAWTPSGASTWRNWASCNSSILEDQLVQAGHSSANQGRIIQSFFAACGSHLGRFSGSAIYEDLQIRALKYEYRKNRLIQPRTYVVDGLEMKALVALKSDPTPRPLVVAICGMACDLDNFTVGMLVMHFFDESPFNMVIVSSLTGNDMIRSNRRFGVGGLEEGKLLHSLTSKIMSEESDIRSRTSSVHLAGLSLGGHAVLYASMYESAHLQRGAPPTFSNAIAICPAMDIKETLEAKDNHTAIGIYYRSVLKRQIRDNIPYVQFVTPVDPRRFDQLPPGEALNYLGDAVLGFYQRLSVRPNWFAAPFQNERIQTIDDVWRLNRLSNFVDKIHVPTLSLSAANDPIIPSEVNYQVASQRLPTGSQLQMIELQKGAHCAFEISYGWDVASAIFRGAILASSPAFTQRRILQTKSISEFNVPRHLGALEQDEKFFGGRWQVVAGEESARLVAAIWTPKRWIRNTIRCSMLNPYYAPDACFRNVEIRIPFHFFEGEAFPITPRHEAEAQAATRWLNTNVRLGDDQHRAWIDTRRSLHFLTWAKTPSSP